MKAPATLMAGEGGGVTVVVVVVVVVVPQKPSTPSIRRGATVR